MFYVKRYFENIEKIPLQGYKITLVRVVKSR